MELQTVLNTFATDIFRKQADLDYVAARANYRMRFRQQFLWSAHQAIEKYLKAILLYNGKSARYFRPASATKDREFGHNLDALLAEVKTISIFSIDVLPEDERFISYLSELGGANRYLSTSSYNTSDAIQRLDRLVWSIRRYCQYIPEKALGCAEPTPGLREATVRSIENPKNKASPHKFRLFRGELESIIKRHHNDPARKALVWANLWYGNKNRNTVTFSSFSSSEIPPNERNWTNVDLDLIEKYVKP